MKCSQKEIFQWFKIKLCVLHNLHLKYTYDFRRTGGSTMRAGVLIIDFLNKGFMKYECLVYNEDYVSLKGKIKQCSESER